MEEKKVIHSSFWSNVFKSTQEGTELYEVLKKMLPFSEMSSSKLKQVLSLAHHRNYIKGELIFHQGDPGIGLYIIREGEVEIVYSGKDNRKFTLANFSETDFFGELALIDGEKRSASAVAKNNCKIAIIFKPDLDEFIQKNPKEGLEIITGISKIIITRLRHLNSQYLNLLDQSQNAEEKLNESSYKKYISTD